MNVVQMVRVTIHPSVAADVFTNESDEEGPVSESLSRKVSDARACPAPPNAVGRGRIATRIRLAAPKRLRLTSRDAARVSQATTVPASLRDVHDQDSEISIP